MINISKKDTAYKDTLSPLMHSSNSSTVTRVADFSGFTKGGNYYLYIQSVGNSYTFSINKNANQAAAKAALKGFYYIRSSMPLEEQYAGKWHRPAGHRLRHGSPRQPAPRPPAKGFAGSVEIGAAFRCRRTSAARAPRAAAPPEGARAPAPDRRTGEPARPSASGMARSLRPASPRRVT